MSEPINDGEALRVRLELLLAQSYMAFIAIAANSAAYAILSARLESGNRPLLAWYVATNVLLVYRIVRHRQWRREVIQGASAERLAAILRAFLVGIGVSGGLWGSIAFFLTGSRDPLAESLIYFMLAGMTAGATVSYSASSTAILAFLAPALLPSIGKLLLMGSPYFVTMATVVALYLALMLRLGRALNRRTLEALRLHFTNVDLVERLRRENAAKEAHRAALQVSQERLTMALQSSAAVAWDFDGERIHWQGDVAAVLGTAAVGPSTRSEYLQLIHPDDRADVERLMAAALAGDLDFDTEHRLAAGGGERCLAVRGRSRHLSGQPGTMRINGIAWDATARRRQESLARQKDAAEAASAAKTRLLANASHEIRTPLAAIDGYARLIQQTGGLSEEMRGYLGLMERNITHLRALVDDLLALAKSDSGEDRPLVTSFSPAEALRVAVAGFQPQLAERRLTAHLEFVGPMPKAIASDARRFRQVVMNLLTNAIKFTPAGGDIRVEVRVVRTYGAGAPPELQIAVSDTGIGIEPELAGRLFQPFVRGAGAKAQKESGSGLGLALSRQLAESLGGDLRLVASGVDRGSSFAFTIPLAPLDTFEWEKVDERLPLDLAASPSESRTDSLEGVRVLLAEDFPDLQILMRTFLERAGAEVLAVDNGRAACEAALHRDVDVVLMDIKMPDMDGFAAVESLRRAGYGRPIIALTAHASKDVQETCMASGFDDFIAKPVDPTVLARTVKAHARSSKDKAAAPPAPDRALPPST